MWLRTLTGVNSNAMVSQEDRVMNSLWRRGSKAFKEETVEQSFKISMEMSSIQLILPGGHCMFMTLRARKIVLVVGGNFERKS